MSTLTCVFILLIFSLTSVSCQTFRRALSDEQMKLARKYLDELSRTEQDDWINPHDMFASKKQQIVKLPTNTVVNEEPKTCECKNPFPFLSSNFTPVPKYKITKEINSNTNRKTFSSVKKSGKISSDFIFLTRWLKRFVDRINELIARSRIEGNEEWERNIILPFNNKYLKNLNLLLKQSQPSMIDIEAIIVDILLNVTIQSSLSDDISDFKFGIVNESFKMYIITLIVLIVVSLIFAFYKRPLVTIIVIIVVVSFVFQWKQLYDEALAKKATALDSFDYDSICKQHKFGIIQSLGFYVKSKFITSGTCKEYYEALMVDPIYEVSGLEALSITLSKFVFGPVKALSHTLNYFIHNLLVNLGGFEQYVAIFLTIFGLLLLCNYSFTFPFLNISRSNWPSMATNTNVPLPDEIRVSLPGDMAKKVKAINLNFNSDEDAKETDTQLEKLCNRLSKSLSISNEGSTVIKHQIEYKQLPITNVEHLSAEDVEQEIKQLPIEAGKQLPIKAVKQFPIENDVEQLPITNVKQEIKRQVQYKQLPITNVEHLSAEDIQQELKQLPIEAVKQFPIADVKQEIKQLPILDIEHKVEHSLIADVNHEIKQLTVTDVKQMSSVEEGSTTEETVEHFIENK